MKDIDAKLLIPNLSSLKDKNVFITGGASGIGFEASKILAKEGANIYLLVRNTSKAEEARNVLLEINKDIKVHIMKIDTSSRKSIKECANEIIDQKLDIDVLLLNAGVYHIPHQYNDEGIELTMATNCIGNYLFIEGLIDYLKELKHESRIIIQSSIAHTFANINYNDFFQDKKYKTIRAYANSKLATVHLYNYLFNKYKDIENIRFYIVHPGSCYTPLIVKAYPKFIQPLCKLFMSLLFHSPYMGSLPSIRAMVEEKCDLFFISPDGFIEMKGKPRIKYIDKKYLKDTDRTIKCILDKLNSKI